MRVLFDECLPRRLTRALFSHDVSTVGEIGWKGLQNGELLAATCEASFDAFITIDRNLVSQQKLDGPANPPLLILILHARSNRFNDLAPLMPAVADALKDPTPRIVHIPS